MSGDEPTRVLTRGALSAAGIMYDEELKIPEALLKECPQASILTRFLLDFEHIIAPERWVSSGMYNISWYVLTKNRGNWMTRLKHKYPKQKGIAS